MSVRRQSVEVVRLPLQRFDCAGLVILLHGDPVIAVTAASARIKCRSGAVNSFYRRPLAEAVPLWGLED
jgi:hypothetical protein